MISVIIFFLCFITSCDAGGIDAVIAFPANNTLICSMVDITSTSYNYYYYYPEYQISNCVFSACPNTTLRIACNEKNGSKLQYLYSIETDSYSSITNQNTSGTTTSYYFRTRSNGSCQDRYIISEYCDIGIPCNNTYTIYNANWKNSIPTSKPTLSFLPTANPVVTYSKVCPSYSANKTKSATFNYVDCSFYACPNSQILVTAVPSYGNLYWKFNYAYDYHQNSISFIMPSYVQCGLYNLRQGCRGINACRGYHTIASSASNPPIMPTVLPIGTPPTSAPFETSSLAVACPKYTSTYSYRTYSNFSSCPFFACGNTFISIPCGACQGDQTIRVSDNSYQYNSIAFNDDSSACSNQLCSSLSFTIPSYYPCQNFNLKMGCYGVRECSGQFTIYGARPANTTTALPTSSPTRVPTSPTLVPTTGPTVAPLISASVAPIATSTVAPTTTSSTVAPTSSPSVASTIAAPTILSQCAMFTASNTNYAIINYQTCSFYVCPGTSVTISTCDNSASHNYSCVGDTYIRLFNSTGSLVTYNDDMNGICGSCSGFSYKFNQPCQYYSLHEGCYGSNTCSGTAHISSTVPITISTAYPTASVTTNPTSATPTFASAVSCKPFSTVFSYCTSLNDKCSNCSFIACPSSTIQIHLSSSGGTQPQRFYLFDPDGNSLLNVVSIIEGQDYRYSFSYSGQCTYFTLVGTCGSYGQSCHGAYTIYGAVAPPTTYPSMSPSNPSSTPISINPSMRPTVESSPSPSTLQSVNCTGYATSNTLYATQNYTICSFYACTGSYVTVTAYQTSGSLYARLYDSGNFYVTGGYNIYYTVTGSCQLFYLHQGCADAEYYIYRSCSGYFVVSNALTSPSLLPTTQPTGPTITPSMTVASSNRPSGPTLAPYFTSSVNCGSFTVTNPNKVLCLFSACGGTSLSISSVTSSSGYIYLSLFDSGALLVASGVYSITFKTPIDSLCQTYTLQQGCYYNGFSCSGNYVVYGGTTAITSTPTVSPSGPSLSPTTPSYAPTVKPSFAPTFASTFHCVNYSATGTYYATTNFATCIFYACPGTLNFKALSSTGSPYIRLKDSLGNQLSAGYLPTSYTTAAYNIYAKCQIYTLLQGCYYLSSCSASIQVDGGFPASTIILPSVETSAPTYSVTPIPTRTLIPTRTPTSRQPTVRPTFSTFVKCLKYSASQTSNAIKNFTVCYFTACAGTFISIIPNDTRNTYAILRDSFGNYLNAGTSFSYTTLSYSSCALYQVHQGCTGTSACSSQYTVAGATASRSFNYQCSSDATVCGIYACPGTMLTISNCDAAGSFTCQGDTLLQLLNTQGISFYSNDDMSGNCGRCSGFTLTLTNSVCQYYTIREGCYNGYGYNAGGSAVCSGTIHITATTNISVFTNASISAAPTAIPTAEPSEYNMTFICDSYSSDSFSIYVRYAVCPFSACPGTSLFITLVNSIGFPQAVLYDSTGLILTTGYATLSYAVSNHGSSCQSFFLRQQCSGTAFCSGTYEVNGGNPPPTLSPTMKPTGPTIEPTLSTMIPTKTPTTNPSFSVSTVCAAYSASNTLNAQSNYVSCSFTACPGTYLQIVASPDYSVTNIYVSLFDAYGNVLVSLISAGSISYAISMFGVCQTYTLRQGCVGTSNCQSRITVEGGAPASLSPTIQAPAVPTSPPSRPPTSRPLTVIPTREPSSMLPSIIPTVSTTNEPTSLVTVLVNLTLSASNQGKLAFPYLNGSIVTSCSSGQRLQPTDISINSNVELKLNNWYEIKSNNSVPTFLFDIAANGPTYSSFIEIAALSGSVCLNSTNIVVQFLSNRINLTYFSPSEGSEHGLDYVTVYPAYQIKESFNTLHISNITVRCMYGPAVDSSVSTQNAVISYGQIVIESNTVLCSPGYADPLLPFNMDSYRVVELWLLWYEGYNSTGGVSASNLIRSELYGDYTFVHSTSSQLSNDVTDTMPFPGSSYVFNPANNNSIVSYVEFFGVNQSRGAVMDLGSLISQCRFTNGSMNVVFYNFSADPYSLLNQSQSDRIAAAMYSELGSFTGFFRLYSMDIALYLTLWSNNVSLAVLEDPLWCPSDKTLHSSVLSSYQRRRLSSTFSKDCISFIQSPNFGSFKGNIESLTQNQNRLDKNSIQGITAAFSYFQAASSFSAVCTTHITTNYIKVTPYSSCYNSDVNIAGQCICQEWLAANRGKDEACSYSLSTDFNMDSVLASLYLSAAAYCNASTYLSRGYIGYTDGFQADASISTSPTSDINGIVGHLDSQSKIFVAFRGTTNLNNWLDTNLQSHLDPYSGGDNTCVGCAVHQGFLTAVQGILERLFGIVSSLHNKFPAYGIIITGHSLGGALATLFALDIVTSSSLGTMDVQLINFGSPRVGNIEFAVWASSKLRKHYRFTHHKDVVPHHPISEIFQGAFDKSGLDIIYQHISGEIYEEGGQLKQCVGYEDPTCAARWTLALSKSDHVNYLNLPISDCGAVSAGPNQAEPYNSNQGSKCPSTLIAASASSSLQLYSDTITSEMNFNLPYQNTFFVDPDGLICGYNDQSLLCGVGATQQCNTNKRKTVVPEDNSKGRVIDPHTTSQNNAATFFCCTHANNCTAASGILPICGIPTPSPAPAPVPAPVPNVPKYPWGPNYYPMRPTPPPSAVGAGHGDVHFASWDGLLFDFHGYGEFVYLISDNVRIHGRQRPLYTSGTCGTIQNGVTPTYTFGIAVSAVSASGTRVNISIVSAGNAIPTVVYTRQGRNTAFYVSPGKRLTIDNSITIRIVLFPMTVTISVYDELTLTIQMGGVYNLDSKISLDKAHYFNNTMGLLGTYTASIDDDFTVPNGTVTVRPGASISEIYTNFGMKWRVTDISESIFYYGPGDYFADHNCPSYVPYLSGRNNLVTSTQRQIYDTFCSSNVSVMLYEQCMDELVLTGFGLSNPPPISERIVSIQRLSGVAIQQNALYNPLPIFYLDKLIQLVYFTPFVLFEISFAAFDARYLPLKYSMVQGPETANVNSTTGLFVWTPPDRSSYNVNVSVSNGYNVVNRFVVLLPEPPTAVPTTIPSKIPSRNPTPLPSFTATAAPSKIPTWCPTIMPSSATPSNPSSRPSNKPTNPTSQPSISPTTSPSIQPLRKPSNQPARKPSRQPSSQPCYCPSTQPIRKPSHQPSLQPLSSPSYQPSNQPSYQPYSRPTLQPKNPPSRQPTKQPHHRPTTAPSTLPSRQPSAQPLYGPSLQPSMQPTVQPLRHPTHKPSSQPRVNPSTQPRDSPTKQPWSNPTMQPRNRPSFQPVICPSIQPSTQPGVHPSLQPACRPTRKPSMVPLAKPSRQPLVKPTRQPIHMPSRSPSSQPSLAPSPLTRLQESIALQNIHFSSLTSNDKVILQQSIRAAVANVTEIPISFISTPKLSSPSSSPSVVVHTSHATQAHSANSQPQNQVSTDSVVIATYTVIGDQNVINNALHHASAAASANSSAGGDNLAALCSATLSANGGNTLLTAIRIQVNNVEIQNSTATSVSSLHTLLANATIAKVTVLVLSPTAAPIRGPPTISTNIPTSSAGGETKPSPSSPPALNIGQLIGIVVGATVFVLIGSYLLYYCLQTRRTSVASVVTTSNNSEAWNNNENVITVDIGSDSLRV